MSKIQIGGKGRIGFAGSSAMAGTILLTCILAAPAVYAQFSGGTGIPEEPYQITTSAQLLAVNNHLDKNFILMNHLDLSGKVYDNAVIAASVGEDSVPFTGSFNGNGKVIQKLNITGSLNGYIGLFGVIGTGGQVINLELTEADVSGYGYVGILAGLSNGGSVNGCKVSGMVNNSGDYTGGLIGAIWNGGTVSNCLSEGTVVGLSSVGGLVGDNDGSIATSCSFAHTTATSDFAGGLVGDNWGVISNSYARGNVAGAQHVGGLVGRHAAATADAITRCYATGVVKGTDFFGGLVGSKELAGDSLTSFWDRDTSFQDTSAMGTGKSTAELHIVDTFYDAGWDFTDIWFMPSADYPRLSWQAAFNEGTGTEADPYRIYTQQQLEAVNDDLAAHYRLMNDLDLEDAYPRAVIAPYIDPASPRFTGSFDGNYRTIRNLIIHDGAVDYAGLIGRIGMGGSVVRLQLEVDLSARSYIGGLAGLSDGTVTDCRVAGIVRGADNYVGGLIGWNNGLTEKCHGAAMVQGVGYVGGLVGANTGKLAYCQARREVSGAGQCVGGLVGTNTGKISECFARGTVTATGNNVGGLAGLNSEGGSVENCYARGAVTGAQHVGGLLGRNVESPVTRCFSTGTVNGSGNIGGLVGSIMGGGDFADINNVWDAQSSVRDTSAMGTASTTVPMKTQAPFTNWNFVFVWALDAYRNDGYPHLQQNLPAQVARPSFNPGGGVHAGTMMIDVMVTCFTTNAMIHYTTDGSEPTDAEPAVSSGGSVPLTLPATLKARSYATGTGLEPSAVHSALFDGKTENGVHFSWLAGRGYPLDGSKDFSFPKGKTQDVRTHFIADLVVDDVNSVYRILSLERASPITVTFSPSSAERVYRLVYTDDLHDDSWLPVPGESGLWQPGDVLAGVLHDTKGGKTWRFYRVEVALPIEGGLNQ